MCTDDSEESSVFIFTVKKHKKYILQFGTCQSYYWCHNPLGCTSKFKCHSGAVYRVIPSRAYIYTHTRARAWSDNTVRELIAVKELHTILLNTTVVAFKVLPLGSYAPMPARSPPFKTILELVLWNGLQSCRCIIPDVISVIKMPSFQYFLYLREQKKVIGG